MLTFLRGRRRWALGFFVLLSIGAGFVQAQQPSAPPLPTHDQLELRLADSAMATQRSLCATLWQQGNDLEQQLKKLQEEHAKLKGEHEALVKLKEEVKGAPRAAE